MPVIPNLRLEQFAKNLAKGLNPAEAFIKAGYANNPHIAAQKSRDPIILSRVEELTAASGEHFENDKILDLDATVAPEKIDKGWVLAQMQSLFQISKKDSNYKVARDVLNDISEVIGLRGGKTSEKDNNGLPLIPEVNLQVFLEKLGSYRGDFVEESEEAIDITPEDEGLVRSIDFISESRGPIQDDPTSIGETEEGLPRETESSG